ncbi:MAG: hypothetical protein Q8L52_02610 [bacterium]|nr:hypothetical protein [bacterium]
MGQFHPSELGLGAKSREEMRFKAGFSEDPTHRLDTAQEILTDALQKHGDEALTRENYNKVMGHARKDARWEHLRSGGSALETHIKTHLGIQD